MSYLDERRNMKMFGKPPKEKKVYKIPKVSEKRKKELQEQKEKGTDKELDKWFEDRRKEMTGRCAICGDKTERNNDKTYRNSLHHIFEKRKNLYPSVKTHPLNCLEVCFYGNSCHPNLTNGTITFEDIKQEYPAAWKLIIEKAKVIVPVMTDEEKNKVPDIVKNEL